MYDHGASSSGWGVCGGGGGGVYGGCTYMECAQGGCRVRVHDDSASSYVEPLEFPTVIVWGLALGSITIKLVCAHVIQLTHVRVNASRNNWNTNK